MKYKKIDSMVVLIWPGDLMLNNMWHCFKTENLSKVVACSISKEIPLKSDEITFLKWIWSEKTFLSIKVNYSGKKQKHIKK